VIGSGRWTYFEPAYCERWREMTWLKVFPYVDPLRDHPRFQALVARLKFPVQAR
jgi:hypothetical protein